GIPGELSAGPARAADEEVGVHAVGVGIVELVVDEFPVVQPVQRSERGTVDRGDDRSVRLEYEDSRVVAPGAGREGDSLAVRGEARVVCRAPIPGEQLRRRQCEPPQRIGERCVLTPQAVLPEAPLAGKGRAERSPGRGFQAIGNAPTAELPDELRYRRGAVST